METQGLERVGFAKGLRNITFNLLKLVSTFLPPFSLEIIALFIVWNGWISLLTVATIFLVCMGTALLAHQLASLRILFELGIFLTNHEYAIFKTEKISDYIAAFGPDHQFRLPLDKEPSLSGIVDFMFHRRIKTDESFLKVYSVIASSPEDHLTFQISTYPTTVNTWMFLPCSPSEMQGIDQFKFRHELGHVSAASSYRSFVLAPRTVTAMCLVLLAFVALRMEINIASGFMLLGLVFLIFLRAHYDADNRERVIIADEISADYFALVRSDLAWFKNHPADMLAKRLCYMNGVPDYEAVYRVRAFEKIISSLRRGEKPQPIEHYLPKLHHSNKLSAIDVIASLLYLGCLWWYLPPTLTTLAYLAIALLIVDPRIETVG